MEMTTLIWIALHRRIINIPRESRFRRCDAISDRRVWNLEPIPDNRAVESDTHFDKQ
jgi:hypothetical protein